MTHSALASRYASALLDVAADPKFGVDPHQVAADLQSFAEVFRGSPELRNALNSPAVPPARKHAVVKRLGELLRISRLTRNFLFVLSDHWRMNILAEVLEAFDLLLDERLGFTRAEVVSASKLNEPQREVVTRELEQLTGKRVRTRFAEDASLVGGLLARIGSTVYDGSVRGQLRALGRRLTGS